MEKFAMNCPPYRDGTTHILFEPLDRAGKLDAKTVPRWEKIQYRKFNDKSIEIDLDFRKNITDFNRALRTTSPFLSSPPTPFESLTAIFNLQCLRFNMNERGMLKCRVSERPFNPKRGNRV